MAVPFLSYHLLHHRTLETIGILNRHCSCAPLSSLYCEICTLHLCYIRNNVAVPKHVHISMYLLHQFSLFATFDKSHGAPPRRRGVSSNYATRNAQFLSRLCTSSLHIIIQLKAQFCVGRILISTSYHIVVWVPRRRVNWRRYMKSPLIVVIHGGYQLQLL